MHNIHNKTPPSQFEEFLKHITDRGCSQECAVAFKFADGLLQAKIGDGEKFYGKLMRALMRLWMNPIHLQTICKYAVCVIGEDDFDLTFDMVSMLMPMYDFSKDVTDIENLVVNT